MAPLLVFIELGVASRERKEQGGRGCGLCLRFRHLRRS